MFAYKATMVVNGLTTVYCNTPSLHLNSNTLQKRKNFSNSSIHLNSFRFSPVSKLKPFWQMICFNSFNLLILYGSEGRMWVATNDLNNTDDIIWQLYLLKDLPFGDSLNSCVVQHKREAQCNSGGLKLSHKAIACMCVWERGHFIFWKLSFMGTCAVVQVKPAAYILYECRFE